MNSRTIFSKLSQLFDAFPIKIRKYEAAADPSHNHRGSIYMQWVFRKGNPTFDCALLFQRNLQPTTRYLMDSHREQSRYELVPHAKTSTLDRTFLHSAIRISNALPDTVVGKIKSDSVQSLKQRVNNI